MTKTTQQFELTSRIFLKAFAIICFSAFMSFGLQITGLIGEDGVLPLGNYLQAAKEALGNEAYFMIPSLFWLGHSDTILQFACLLGMFFSLLLFFLRLPTLSLFFIFMLYLSLYHAGQAFMSFQWDIMLLEVAFLSLLLVIFSDHGKTVIVWLFRLLVFKFMLMGGIVKLFSGDKSWDSLTALSYHFETQPLPTPLAWHAHHLPDAFLIAGTALTLFIELILPFFIFTFRRFRMSVGFVFILFQSVIILTGNYNFFNLLTIAICLFLFDDVALRKIFRSAQQPAMQLTSAIPLNKKLGLVFTVSLIVILNISTVSSTINIKLPEWVAKPAMFFQPFNLVNQYGPFAVMTKQRNEIIIEGSNDRANWKEYEFKYKPGDVTRGGSWLIPHQPRLDWQMWFAALGNIERNPWLLNTMLRLLQNNKDVIDLFETNPFPDSAPEYIRAQFYRYEFTEPNDFLSEGPYWKRLYIKNYYPTIRLTDNP